MKKLEAVRALLFIAPAPLAAAIGPCFVRGRGTVARDVLCIILGSPCSEQPSTRP
jgi:hypothetical protein